MRLPVAAKIALVSAAGADGGARLADAAPFAPRLKREVDLDFGRVLQPHDRIGVEIALLDAPSLMVIRS